MKKVSVKESKANCVRLFSTMIEVLKKKKNIYIYIYKSAHEV